MGTLFGPMLGAGVYVGASEMLSSYIAQWRLVLGLLLVFTVMFAPRGLISLRTVAADFLDRRGGRPGPAETDGLTKQFGQLVAVDDVTLSVDRGEIRSIIGPNGAGKSTFFNLVTGLMLPTDGTVTFDGEDIIGLKPYEIARRGVARSFQITDVFGGLSAFENVRIAAQVGHDKRDSFFAHADDIEEVNEVAHRVLEDIELADRADQRAADFAYGDRRKLEIGLTIANDPDLLLLDEPTAGMSREETINAIRMIRRLAEEREFTLLLIEHDLEVVMNISDRVTVLQEGGVIAEGPPDQVQQDEVVREAYIGGALS